MKRWDDLTRKRMQTDPLVSFTSSPVTFTSFSNPNKFHHISKTYYGNCSSVNGFKKLNRVGEGTYGIVSTPKFVHSFKTNNLFFFIQVYRAKSKSNEIVALKRVRMDQDSHEGFPISALREISLLTRLSHDNIVSVYEVGVGEGLENVFMIMEYCAQDMAYLSNLAKIIYSIE